MTIIWCMVPEIWRVTDRNFCHFGPFFTLLPPNNLKNQNVEMKKTNSWRYYHFPHVHHEWQSYDVCFLRYGAWRREFFVILNCFSPFYPLTTWKIKNRLEILPLYIHVYHKGESYDIWFLRYGVHFLLFWTIFCPFIPLTTRKIKILKK